MCTCFSFRKNLRLASTLFAVLFLASSFGSVAAQEKEKSKFSKSAKSELKMQQARIKKELASATLDEWAGEYYYGDGLGVNVDFSMAPKSGFAFTWNGCLGLYDLNYGDVTFEDGRYKLKFRYPNKREGFEGIAGEFIPVRWSARHYLIAPEQLTEFLNGVNSGFEAQTRSIQHRFLLKLGDESLPVNGFPDVPPKYRTFLLSAPIRAQISSVGTSKGSDDERVTEVVINAGSADGVRPGMEFYLSGVPGQFEEAQIVNISEHSSDARIRQYGKNRPTPTTEWKLSTSAVEGSGQ